MATLDNIGWVQRALANQLNRAEQELNWGRTFWDQFADSLKSDILFPAGGEWRGQGIDATNQLYSGLFGYNPVDVFRASGEWRTPDLDQALWWGREAVDRSRNLGDISRWRFQDANPDFDFQNALHAANYMMSGQNPVLADAAGFGSNFLQTMGSDPMAEAYRNFALRALSGEQMDPRDAELQRLGSSLVSGGGWMPQVDRLSSLAESGFSPSGLDLPLDSYRNLFARGSGEAALPVEQQVRDVGRDIVTERGATPQSTGLTSAASAILGRNPLMSPDQAASFAAELAGQRTRNAAREAYARALARGGGPGNIVASGMQNQEMADFQDQALQAQSSAIIDALMKQQGLGLDQWGRAAGMLGDAGQLENQRMQVGLALTSDPLSRELQRQQLLLSTGSLGDRLAMDRWARENELRLGGSRNVIDALQSAGQLANQRLGLGIGLASDPLSRDIQRQQLALGTGQTSDRIALERMGLGANLLGTAGNLQQGFLGQLGNIAANRAQYNLGLGSLAGNMDQQLGQLGQGSGNIALQMGQLGLNRGDMINRAIQQGFGQQQDFVRNAFNVFQGSFMEPMFRLMAPANQAFTAGINAVTGGVPVGQGGGTGIGGQLLNTAVGAMLRPVPAG